MISTLALLALTALAPVRRDSPTGVIVVLLDDVGPEMVAQAPTPTLDQLAATGRTYPVMWGAPSCSNARAQLMAGRYPFRAENRIGTNVRETGLHRLPPSPYLLPAMVTASGRTATLLGKWHLAPEGQLDHPLLCGFSHFAGTEANLEWGSGSWSYFEWLKVVDGEAFVQTGYVTSDTIDDAIDEVEGGTHYILVALHAAHSPRHCPPIELAPNQNCASSFGKRIAMLEAADTEIGRLVEVALPAGYVVIVTADNGPGQDGDGGKWSVYESGLRVPMIVAGNDVAPGESPAIVSLVDLVPTVMDILGIEYEHGWYDGESFADDLRGIADTTDGPLAPRYLYSEYFNTGAPHSLYFRRAIRDERWKLHTGNGYPPDELYDLLSDPQERSNLLAGTLTEEQESALQALREHLPK